MQEMPPLALPSAQALPRPIGQPFGFASSVFLCAAFAAVFGLTSQFGEISLAHLAKLRAAGTQGEMLTSAVGDES